VVYITVAVELAPHSGQPIPHAAVTVNTFSRHLPQGLTRVCTETMHNVVFARMQ
jgi:hypothetical protein